MKPFLIKYIVLIVIGLGLCGVAQANPSGSPKQGGGKHMEKVKAELGLTDAQVAKLTPIFESMHQERKALKQDAVLTKEEKHKQMKALHEKYAGQIAAILTPDQLAKWKALKQQHAKKKASAPAVT